MFCMKSMSEPYILFTIEKCGDIIVDPHSGLAFMQSFFDRCGHLGWPRVNLWLAVGAPVWCF